MAKLALRDYQFSSMVKTCFSYLKSFSPYYLFVKMVKLLVEAPTTLCFMVAFFDLSNAENESLYKLPIGFGYIQSVFFMCSLFLSLMKLNVCEVIVLV